MADQDSNSGFNSKTAEVLQDFLEDEILKSQDSLRRSRMFGVIVIAVVTGYMGYITNGLRAFLEPVEAASMTTSFIETQVSAKTDLLAGEIKGRIPALISGLPDHFLAEIPRYRRHLEETVITGTRTHMQEVAENLEVNLASFIEGHKENINKMLTASNEIEITEDLKEALTDDILDFLATVPPNGESVVERIAKSLEVLKQAEAAVDRLAANADLSPPERKTRYALAVLADSIQDQMHQLKVKVRLER
jgi:hypothetical protein